MLDRKVYWVTFKYTQKAQWVSRVKVGESVKGTIEYGSSPSKKYVTVTARDGLVKALGGRY